MNSKIQEDLPEITLRKIFGETPRVKAVDFFGSSKGRFILDSRVCDYERESQEGSTPPMYLLTLKIEGSPTIHKIRVYLNVRNPIRPKELAGQMIRIPFLKCPLCDSGRKRLYLKGDQFGCGVCFKLYSLDKALSSYQSKVTLGHLEQAKNELEEFRGRNRKYANTLKKLEMRVKKIQRVLSERIEDER